MNPMLNYRAIHGCRLHARRRAMTLIEVVMAVAILGLVIPAIAIQIAASVKSRCGEQTDATLVQLASERLNEILADHANPKRGYAYIATTAYPAESNPHGLAGYARTTEVREVSEIDFTTPKPGGGIKRFVIDVVGPGERTLRIESAVTDVPGYGG